MRHRRKTKYFSRKFNARKALLRGLIVSLVEHGRICTTVDKAKELRRHAEKAVTLGKKGDLGARRLLLSRLPHVDTVAKIMGDISPRFATREGGYTRIIKIGRRPGDTAEMAFIEFVDYDYKTAAPAKKTAAPAKGKADADTKKNQKLATKVARKAKAVVANKRKNLRKIQSDSRIANRA